MRVALGPDECMPKRAMRDGDTMNDFNWTCPHCERAVTISRERSSSDAHALQIKNADGWRILESQYLVCPNPDCQRFTLSVALLDGTLTQAGFVARGRVLERWTLVPFGASRQFPDYIPAGIRDDYREACLIRDLSPKASATLSRRCLQGIIRDFWNVKPGRLVDEIEQVKDRVDPETWEAIEAVRKLGNIGAHMEKDIDVIVEVDPDEAGHLTGLVETLLSEWYVAREQRRARMSAVKAAAQNKP